MMIHVRTSWRKSKSLKNDCVNWRSGNKRMIKQMLDFKSCCNEKVPLERRSRAQKQDPITKNGGAVTCILLAATLILVVANVRCNGRKSILELLYSNFYSFVSVDAV